MEREMMNEKFVKANTTHFYNEESFEEFINKFDIKKIKKISGLTIKTESDIRIDFESTPKKICNNCLTVGSIRISGSKEKCEQIKRELRNNTCYRKGDSVNEWWTVNKNNN